MDGLYAERYGRQERQFRPFTVHFRPAGIPHQDEIGPNGVRFFEIEVRPSWRKRMEDCSAALDLARDDTQGGELLWLAMKIFREVQGAETTDDLSIETLLAELMAGAARMRRERLREHPAWLERIVDKLAVEYCERLTLDELSREAGVHPVHLSRVFRKCMGEGIGEHVHRLRVRAACEQMLEAERSIAEISAATGFGPESFHAGIPQNGGNNTGSVPGAGGEEQVSGIRFQESPNLRSMASLWLARSQQLAASTYLPNMG